MENKFYNYLYDYIIKEGFTSDKNPKDQKEKMLYVKEYIEKLGRVHEKDNNSDSNLLKNMYLDRYVIKYEDIPDSYFKHQEQMYLERGYGHYTMSENEKRTLADVVINDQTKSLENILDYFLSEDAEVYPDILKFWAFQGLIHLGSYNKETEEFGRRTKGTTAPFVELNHEALALTIDEINNFLKNEEVEDEEILKSIFNNNGGLNNSFSKMYTHYLKYINGIKKSRVDSDDGVWIKYDQGSDHMKLVKTLEGKGTGWCTAGASTAERQLNNGDFYIYYTKGESNQYTEPRIAIRMDGHDTIGEIRGVASNQNIEPNMEKVLDEKLEEFPDKDEYKKKVKDMKMLTSIYNKNQNNIDLSTEELRFLYQIDNKIQGFGYEEDSRIEEVKSKRNVKQDLCNIFDCTEEQIATSLTDFESNEIVVFGNDLVFKGVEVPETFSKLKYIFGSAEFFSLKSAKNLKSLQSIGGAAYFSNLTSAEGLESLQTIGWDAVFSNLTSAKGLESLQIIGNDANFNSLTEAEGLKSLQTIGRAANFPNLTRAEGLKSLQKIGGTANFKNLISAEGLESLQTIGYDANFNSLTEAEGLKSLQTIGWRANFNSLTNAEGLESLQTIDGIANFPNLTRAEGLKSLQKIGVTANFSNLTSAKGLESLQTIGWDANFNSLTEAEGLGALLMIEGTANFNSLTSAEGLKSLRLIVSTANFNSLARAEGLKSLQVIGGTAYFSSLTKAEDLESLLVIGGNAYFDKLISAKGLELLEIISRDANFNSLTSAEGLKSLQKIGGDAYFENLTSAEGLESLQTIGGEAHFPKLIQQDELDFIKRNSR